MAKILVIDDEETIRSLLRGALERKGHTVKCAENGMEGVSIYSNYDPDTVICDIKMPKMDGFQVFESLKHNNKKVAPFIYITGHGEKAAAIEALRKGAFDYLEKPFEMDEIFFAVDRAIESWRLNKENNELNLKLEEANQKLSDQLSAKSQLVRRIQSAESSPSPVDTPMTMEILGESPAMEQVKSAIERLTKSALGANMSVLITGPSGSGKEIAARLLHEHSQRRNGPWVPLNCGAIPENLMEAELFGSEKGAFTGANERKPGVFEMANGGTLFLDEIGELPINMQAKLLRALQEQTFRRIGGKEEIVVDVRIIAATNKNLELAVKNKEFREDLLYRLNSLPLQLPSLKARGSQEILRLADFMLSQTILAAGFGPSAFSEASRDLLVQYEWPGNIRELKSVVQRAALLTDGNLVSENAMKSALGKHPTSPISMGTLPSADIQPMLALAHASPGSGEEYDAKGYHEWKRAIVMDMERKYLERQLSRFHGNVSAMSRFMKVTRPNLCRLLKKHALNAEAFRQRTSESTASPEAA